MNTADPAAITASPENLTDLALVKKAIVRHAAKIAEEVEGTHIPYDRLTEIEDELLLIDAELQKSKSGK